MIEKRRRERHTVPDAGRLITFLDAAVAIALTLLVLPLVERVPETARAGEAPIELVTGNLAPLGAFLLSFWVIWRFWTVHHELFAHAGVVGPALMRLNLVWLLSIVLLPFVTEMVASFRAEPVVVRLYVGLLLVTSACLTAMVVLMRRAAGEGEGPPATFLVGSIGATLGMAVAFVVVLVAPGAGYWPLLVLLLEPLVTPVVARLYRRLAGREGATS